MNAGRRKAALAVPTAAGEGISVSLGYVGRLQFRERQAAEQRHNVLTAQFRIAFVRAWGYLSLHVLDPPLEEAGDGLPLGLDVSAALHLGDQPRAFLLGLPLGALERVPAALALSGLRIANVDDDGPMAGGTLADMAFHSSLHHLRRKAYIWDCRAISLSNFSLVAVSLWPNVSVIPNCASLSFSSLNKFSIVGSRARDSSSLWIISVFIERLFRAATRSSRRRRASENLSFSCTSSVGLRAIGPLPRTTRDNIART